MWFVPETRSFPMWKSTGDVSKTLIFSVKNKEMKKYYLSVSSKPKGRFLCQVNADLFNARKRFKIGVRNACVKNKK